MGFPDFLGNEKIVAALRGAFRSGRVPHALLFTGPRGVGKYTLARMFARQPIASGLPTISAASAPPASALRCSPSHRN